MSIFKFSSYRDAEIFIKMRGFQVDEGCVYGCRHANHKRYPIPVGILSQEGIFRFDSDCNIPELTEYQRILKQAFDEQPYGIKKIFP